ncbi:MAG: hypothetical protein IJI14_09180, partial [Anaerolineaceae bacterium]|nr:hypothetical protein [Anaerolineaceae bacterium]
KSLKNRLFTFAGKHSHLLIACAAGIAAFLLVFGLEPLRWTGTGWLLEGYSGDDITQHQTGWEFYRRSPWTFPLCKALYLGYPEGTAVSYTDSIPVIALFFKIIAGILPEHFQYFGMYTCLYFALQGLFSAALVFHFTRNKIFSAVCSVIFVMSSCFLERCFRHTALSSHWLLLAALLLYFIQKNIGKNEHISVKYHIRWGILLCLALGIHPYLFAMCFGVFAVSEFEVFLKVKQLRSCLSAAAVVLSVIVFGFVLGLFGTEVSSAQGFGIYSLNLNALFNSYTGNYTQWSAAGAERPIYAGQKDGIYYMGLFMNVVFVLSVAVFLLSGSENIRRKLKKYIFMIFLLAGYTLFAVSNIVSFDDHVIFMYRIPDSVLDKLNIFRASGRFFFIPYYCIILFSLISLYRNLDRKWFSIAAAVLLASVQIMEIEPGLKEMHSRFETRKNLLFLSNDWSELAENYDKAVSFDCLTDRKLAFWLARSGFKTNMMITAPIHMNAYWERTRDERNQLRENLETGDEVLDRDTIYIISENTGYNCTFEEERELIEYTEKVRTAYKGKAELIYLTDWVKNYWILVPNK